LVAQTRQQLLFNEFEHLERTESELISIERARDHSQKMALDTASKMFVRYPFFHFAKAMVCCLEQNLLPAASAALLDVFTTLRSPNSADRNRVLERQSRSFIVSASKQ
jgi:hypothetical protein